MECCARLVFRFLVAPCCSASRSVPRPPPCTSALARRAFSCAASTIARTGFASAFPVARRSGDGSPTLLGARRQRDHSPLYLRLERDADDRLFLPPLRALRGQVHLLR